MNLEIFIVTYNRASYLKKTLGYLRESVLKDYPITVLNNNSTDDTKSVAEEMSTHFTDLKIITHKNNVGGDANIMKAFELSNGVYTWVLCDDDDLYLNEIEDVLAIIEKGEVDLIHTGAHPEIAWAFGGKKSTPRQLLNEGYHYFKASSFIPCNIFKTEKFQKQFLIAGYLNIKNAYPHMPYVYNIYEQDDVVYLSQKKITEASVVGQSYNLDQWFFWWLNTTMLVKTKEGVRAAFFDHFNENNDLRPLYRLMAELSIKKESFYYTILSFANQYFTRVERSGYLIAYRKLKARKALSGIKNKVTGSKRPHTN